MKKKLLFLTTLLLTFNNCQKSPKTYVDKRDNQTYRYVEIDSLDWMLDNANIELDSSWCYQNNLTNCQALGRLYPWKIAMKACPDEWRLPTRDEWLYLSEFLGGKNWYDEEYGSQRLYKIMSGDNEYGFALFKGGMYNPELDKWFDKEIIGSYWSSDQFASHAAVCAVLNSRVSDSFIINPGTRLVAHSCRCVRASK